MGKKSRLNKAPKKKRVPFVERPYEGLTAEVELVAMKEILPAATASATTAPEYGSREITLVTLLPNMAAAVRREDGELLVAVQTVTGSGDASRDLAALIIDALELEPGEAIQSAELAEPGPRLSDVLVDQPLDLVLYEDFAYWVSDEEKDRDDVRQAIEQTRDNVAPTVAIDAIRGAYWVRMTNEFVRWIRTEDQDRVLDGLARLQTARSEGFDKDARFVGAFRACGLLIPVWQLAPGTEADELSAPMATFEDEFAAAIAATEPLTPEERRARSGIVSRQVTLR
ncbi:DUF5926 family protein [Flaviflexus equikiangi]|uniref:Topoisomerase II n=1 Tax=Flaviflexus equikiangi TaxID=2758573 RepID=A0ABS2TET6_9ACTO|nr:DUF5926 family protein [Flaviflexus equikiangi]MBM9432272.1 topoisomerase II [Flaviflexus equikiangi]